jgi:hypothetical protein
MKMVAHDDVAHDPGVGFPRIFAEGRWIRTRRLFRVGWVWGNGHSDLDVTVQCTLYTVTEFTYGISNYGVLRTRIQSCQFETLLFTT